MTGLFPRLLAIGADPADGPELRLRKALLLTAVAMFAPAGVIWGILYVVAGEPDSAVWPWLYTAIAAVSIPLLALTRRYQLFATIHFLSFLIIPFLLMWSLGGFITGSLVALWSWIAPLTSRTIGHRRAAFALFVAFIAGIALSALLEPVLDSDTSMSDLAITLLFVLNAVAVGSISMVLVDASAGGREGSLDAMWTLVHRYFSPDVAQAIMADPDRQELGGELADVTVLFADLGGYTSYSSARSPHEVVELLNAMFAAALPAIEEEGGTPITLPGDAVVAIFGAPRKTTDHATCAARAGLAIQAATAELARSHGDWPQYRIGINSGDALVGNIGSDSFRNFTAVGDTVNMAQRLSSLAQPGQVVTGRLTAERLGGGFVVQWLDQVFVKGKPDPVRPGILSRDG